MVAFDLPSLVVPATVVVDTSFIVEALLSGQRYHPECSEALVRLADEGTELVYSRLLELELIEAAYKAELGKHWRRVRHDGRARRRAARVSDAALDAWTEVASAMPARRVEIPDVVRDVPDLMYECGLGSYDAIHAATAQYAGTHDLYTLDAGFARVPPEQLTIYTLSSKLPRLRGIRAGNVH